MYTFDIDPQALFEDRAHQFAAFGIPPVDITAVRANVTDMWADAPGGWSYEWSRLAEKYISRGEHFLAASAYGCGRFPCLNTQGRIRAHTDQLTQYLEAAPSFPVAFQRRIITVGYQGEQLELPIHLYSATADFDTRPVLLAHGGVDTFKMDFHPFAVALTLGSGMTTLAIDMPGTGETPAALARSADDIVAEVVRYARSIGDGRVAHFGMSFGGNFAATSGLTRRVDAAINLGGPVLNAFTAPRLAELPYGMRDIVGNALHLDAEPSLDELVTDLIGLSRAYLLAGHDNAPMLVINGADDYFVPQSDTQVFNNRPDTQVHLLENTGHCAISRLSEVIPMITEWLQTQFASTKDVR